MRWIVWLVVLAACSSGSGPIQHPPGGGSAPAQDAASVAAGPSERDCDELIAHVIELRLAELRPTTLPERMPTDAELAQLRTDLRADPGCRALSIDRYRCALAARTLADLAACHSMPSSSTSNSRVAPGGIAPPAAPVLP